MGRRKRILKLEDDKNARVGGWLHFPQVIQKILYIYNEESRGQHIGGYRGFTEGVTIYNVYALETTLDDYAKSFKVILDQNYLDQNHALERWHTRDSWV